MSLQEDRTRHLAAASDGQDGRTQTSHWRFAIDATIRLRGEVGVHGPIEISRFTRELLQPDGHRCVLDDPHGYPIAIARDVVKAWGGPGGQRSVSKIGVQGPRRGPCGRTGESAAGGTQDDRG